MREIREDLERWLAADESIALATVVEARGSSPRPLGSRMGVTESGRMAGSVSGGCVEGDVFREAQAVLAGGQAKRLRYEGLDEEGWEVGLACGGTIDVFVEPFNEIHRVLLESLQRGETVAMATRVDGRGHLIAWPDGRFQGDRDLAPQLGPALEAGAFSSSTAELRRAPEADVFVEVFARPPVLNIVGAVHIAVPLVAMARVLGFHVRLVDARRAFATEDRFPDVDEMVVAWPRDALEPQTLRSSDALVVLTHDPKFDVPALEVALRSPVGYIGLLGSDTTQEERLGALKERGFSDEDLSRIHGPVGLDIGGRRPAEIALAILAEIVRVRNEES
jgi:xanthine dehydrogenase accessory factor